MSASSTPTYNAKDYVKYRPVYPETLYTHLRKYIGLQDDEKVPLAVDLGCGSGQATLTLAKLVADKVFGIDASETMMKEGRESAGPSSNIDFVVGNDGTLTSQLKKHSVDLLTVAEAAHWFSYPDFWEAAHYVLKPGGTLAIWSYYIPNAVGHPEAVKIIEDFSFNKEKCGGYWNPGQDRLNDLYASFTLPPNLYELEERTVNDYNELRPEQPFELVKHDVPVQDLINLLGTWSGYLNWKKANPDKKDILEEAQERLLSEANLSLDSRVSLKWNSVYIFAKTKKLSE